MLPGDAQDDLGADIVDKVIVGSAQWSELFVKHDFFHKYRYYLQIIASTGDGDLQIKWYVLHPLTLSLLHERSSAPFL